LEPLHLTASSAVKALDVSRKTLSKIINERGSVTPDMVLRLSKAFDTSPELWLNLQSHYDLWQASRESHAWQRAKVLSPHCW